MRASEAPKRIGILLETVKLDSIYIVEAFRDATACLFARIHTED